MNFRPRPKEEPEINLIPFIDVLPVADVDANARHQAVITVMETAPGAGLAQMTCASQSTADGSR
jgi:biopolymer transport protein ExbD